METQIIVALSLMLLILLFVTWIDRHKRRKDEEHLIQKTLKPLQTQISQLENSVKALLQNNQRDARKNAQMQTQISQLENSVKALPQNNRDAFAGDISTAD